MKITNVQSVLNQLQIIHNNQPEAKSSVQQYVVAKALAFDAIIPSQEVSSPRAYYLENIARPLEALLSQINEVVVLNFNTTTETAYRIWLARYNLVYDCMASDDLELYKCLRAQSVMDAIVIDGFNRTEKQVGFDIADSVRELVRTFQEKE